MAWYTAGASRRRCRLLSQGDEKGRRFFRQRLQAEVAGLPLEAGSLFGMVRAMPGDVLGTDLETIYYIQSEDAFRRARMRGHIEVARAKLTGHDSYLFSFRQAVGDVCPLRVIPRGVEEIAVKDIVGSVGREREFTCHFHPLTSSARQKERWRLSYARSRAGGSYQPIEVCKVGRAYFVVNGHHRVSVARYLNWRTIQARVSEVVAPAVL